jgi:hypothetical protein
MFSHLYLLPSGFEAKVIFCIYNLIHICYIPILHAHLILPYLFALYSSP